MTTATGDTEAGTRRRGTPGEVFLAFLKLGLTSFGGPIAHLGYYRDELVTRRRWIDDAGYADLVALCQFLPGPASSQVGFALGLLRAGPLGAAAAWLSFTLPSAIFLVLFAFGADTLEGPLGEGLIAGLKIVAVSVVAHAVWGMARTLCPDRERAGIALAAVVIVVFVAGAFGQVSAILAGGLAGLWLCRNGTPSQAGSLAFGVPRGVGIAALALFFLLLAGVPILAAVLPDADIALFDAFYRAGALVFGGGHVVLPLLEAEIVPRGWVTPDAFLAGYGAAQAIPGPLFTFAGYLGVLIDGIPGALLGLVAIFLPGFLLVVGALPFWDAFRTRPAAQAAMRGANAAVVGILGAALYDPVWTSAILTPHHFALALAGFLLLAVLGAQPWLVVILGAAGGVGLAFL